MLDSQNDVEAYILGILWGTMSQMNEVFWARHRDIFFIQAVKKYLGIKAKIQTVSTRTGIQYRLKIVRPEIVNKLNSILTAYGWTPRQSIERCFPHGELNERGFIRAWVELHGVLDIRNSKRRDGAYCRQKRLRIYGNSSLLEKINLILCEGTKFNPRKLQKTGNEITKCIYFQGSSVDPVFNWLYAGAQICNPSIKGRFEEVLLDVH